MNTSVILFIVYGLNYIMQFIAGYFFMKCMDCTIKRRDGKLAFLLALVLYSIVSTVVIFPTDG